ncbi:MAG: pyruvate:ferredoxin (flavodoxin) oxidoreductase [Planctomycetes bacterium]|nr:pyruvate:ferredoxin (flavodoxin) oxidoreductase [Planctomycetota bacterium]
MARRYVTVDGNESLTHVAHKLSEVIAIYPITPASPMGEFADLWSAQKKPNLWGTIPLVLEMQSEGGAAAAVHGAIQTGALSCTFTASQGLLLMLPNMFKIAGELTPTVIHVSARTLATHALSIFGDHSDVMAARSTGFAILASNSVQEVMDTALIAHASTIEARVPFLHFFDGFRTSHEVAKIEELTMDDLRAMIDDDLVLAHRSRALTPDRPVLRGTAMNPDVFFQAREANTPFYRKTPEIVQRCMDRFASIVGRQYNLFDYEGVPDAERVIVIMGSAAEPVGETVEYLNKRGEKVGVIKVRLFRPFSVEHFIAALPATVRSIAVLDRTKEPGAAGEPLYEDVVTAMFEGPPSGRTSFATPPRVIGGRYGLSSKEFDPGMIKAVFDELAKESPKNHFTVGIDDDVSHTSLDYDDDFSVEADDVYRAVFIGLGADGTVSANKNSIKIIGEETENYAQGYFVYDSKKSGSMTISHLRFGPRPIRSTYLVKKANFVGVHQYQFLEKYDVLKYATEGATFLLNSPFGPDEVWDKLPQELQETIIKKKLRFFVVDAYEVARETGMGQRINTIMQTCFFQIAKVIPPEQAIGEIKKAIEKTYGKKGEKIVKMNFNAVDQTLANLHEVKVQAAVTSKIKRQPVVSPAAPEYVKDVLAPMIEGNGDLLPVSKLPIDGTFPTGTARWEKRNVALEIPVWDPEVCIQCNKCVIACPHAAIRAKAYGSALLSDAPPTFKSIETKAKELEGLRFTIQVAPEDCTGCGVCVHVCPAKNKAETRLKAINLEPQMPLREPERINYEFFLGLPELDRRTLKTDSVRGSQLLEPLFEASGACPGCGETPYVKLVSQLFGDRLLVGNATGCSSIYCGNLPNTPWTKNRDGRGPAWSNSLFEDNAEFGMGFAMTHFKQRQFAQELVTKLSDRIGADLAGALVSAPQKDEADIYEQRLRVEMLRQKLEPHKDQPEVRQLLSLADFLVKKSIWVFGGDGWAYDIGYGGLDHVIATGLDINILVLDTEVYSNTGGQMSKATPLGAVAKFAAAGKPAKKKELGLLAMTYGNVYVGQVALGANDAHTVRTLIEAESYEGPSLIIAYSHCIAHGINMRTGMDNQKLAVQSGQWLLYRFNPDLVKEGKSPFQLDSRKPTKRFEEYAYLENRFRMLQKTHPQEAQAFMQQAQKNVDSRWKFFTGLSELYEKMYKGNGN